MFVFIALIIDIALLEHLSDVLLVTLLARLVLAFLHLLLFSELLPSPGELERLLALLSVFLLLPSSLVFFPLQSAVSAEPVVFWDRGEAATGGVADVEVAVVAD
jgi:hypothetical protein